jgi:thioredoxin-like negative regulator of GroEL
MSITKQFNSFEDLLSSSDLPLLVVFYSPLCGPSHMMESILDQVNTHMKQQLKIVKIDSEKYSELASQYHIHPLPTLILFKNGQPIERIEAEHTEHLMSAEHLIQRLQSLV